MANSPVPMAAAADGACGPMAAAADGACGPMTAAGDGACGEQQPSFAATSSFPVPTFQDKLLAALGCSTGSDDIERPGDDHMNSPVSLPPGDEKDEELTEELHHDHAATASTAETPLESKSNSKKTMAQKKKPGSKRAVEFDAKGFTRRRGGKNAQYFTYWSKPRRSEW